MRLKALMAIAALGGVAGCTVIEPVSGDSPQLAARIAAGEVIHPGERVVLTTRDGWTHKLTVNAITDDRVVGDRESVETAQIVGVERRHFSTGRTVAIAAAGTVIVVGGLLWAGEEQFHHHQYSLYNQN